MTIVPALPQIQRNRLLCRDVRGQRTHDLATPNYPGESACGYPSDTVTGSKALGERSAVQDQAFAVERLGRLRALRPKIQLGVDVVFNQGDIACRQQLDELIAG